MHRLLYVCVAKLTPWSKALLDKQTIAQLFKKLPTFMEPKGLSPCSQKPATSLYPDSHEPSP
jgi:hypothetical protein